MHNGLAKQHAPVTLAKERDSTPNVLASRQARHRPLIPALQQVGQGLSRDEIHHEHL